MSQEIGSALNETSLSLDFVSLLISAVKPNLAKTTISPHLIKNVPLGSLASDRLTTDGEDTSKRGKQLNIAKLGQGWKNEAISRVISVFKSASENLEKELTKEETYWNMINLVLNNNEILFKTRDPLDGSKTIGVKYGYGDSGSSFHDKGLAILRRNKETGEISFNPISHSNKIIQKQYKYVRVKILSKIDDDYMVTGQTIFNKDFDFYNNKIVKEIEKARYFLFEEDLFYQLTREAKTLINYYVSIISNKIIIEVNNEIIEIESIVYDESNEDDLTNYYQNTNSYSSIHNNKSQLILNYLKIMLCCYYKYKLKLKQKLPTALTKHKQFNSHPLILRPLLGNMKHEGNIVKMRNIFTNILDTYKDSTISNLSVRKFVNLDKKSDNPFQKSVEKPCTTFEIIIKKKDSSHHLRIDLELTTNEIFVDLVLKLNISKFQSLEDLNNNLNGYKVLQINFMNFNDIKECLEWSILNFVQE